MTAEFRNHIANRPNEKNHFERLLIALEDVPGMIAVIKTFGELLNFHPHIHAIATDGVLTPDGTFLCLPRIEKQLLLEVWKNKVFELFVATGKLDQGCRADAVLATLRLQC